MGLATFFIEQWFAWGGKASKMLSPVCRAAGRVGHQSWLCARRCRLYCAASICSVSEWPQWSPIAKATACCSRERRRWTIKKRRRGFTDSRRGRLHLVFLDGDFVRVQRWKQWISLKILRVAQAQNQHSTTVLEGMT